MNLFEKIAFWWRTRGLPDLILDAQLEIAEYECSASRAARARIENARTESERRTAIVDAANQYSALMAGHRARP